MKKIIVAVTLLAAVSVQCSQYYAGPQTLQSSRVHVRQIRLNSHLSPLSSNQSQQDQDDSKCARFIVASVWSAAIATFGTLIFFKTINHEKFQ